MAETEQRVTGTTEQTVSDDRIALIHFSPLDQPENGCMLILRPGQLLVWMTDDRHFTTNNQPEQTDIPDEDDPGVKAALANVVVGFKFAPYPALLDNPFSPFPELLRIRKFGDSNIEVTTATRRYTAYAGIDDANLCQTAAEHVFDSARANRGVINLLTDTYGT